MKWYIHSIIASIPKAKGFRTDAGQMVLFDADPSPQLAEQLGQHFGASTTKSELVIQYTEDNTPYTGSHARKALDLMETDRRIVVDPAKADGSRRRARTFPPGTIIHF